MEQEVKVESRSRKTGIILTVVALAIASIVLFYITRGAAHASITSFPSDMPYAAGSEVYQTHLNARALYAYNRESVTVTVNAPAAGYYILALTYRPIYDTVQPMELRVTVGNTSYLAELGQIYTFENFPFLLDDFGDERRPRLNKNMEARTNHLFRADGFLSSPILFPLVAGSNEVTLESLGGSKVLYDIHVMSIRRLPDYAAFRSHGTGQVAAGQLLTVEAENVSAISHRTIQLHSISESGLSPETFGRITFNTIGGHTWRLPNEWIEWTLNVPVAGYYNIAFKYQNNISQTPALHSYRRVEVNGEVLFSELLNVAFPFSAAWSNLVLGGEETPFTFFFEAGQHTLRLTTVNEPYAVVHDNLMRIAEEIRQLDLYIRGITGVRNDQQVDVHRIFQLERYIPDLAWRLASLAADVQAQMDMLSYITGAPSASFDQLRHEVRNLTRFSNNLNLLTNSYDALLRPQTNIASFAITLTEQPVLLDTVMAVSAGDDFPGARPGMLANAAFMTRQLVSSFTDDRGTVAVRDPNVLQVWSTRNRDNINVVQAHINEFFTPYSGIEVAVTFLPGADILILANAAGNQPAVVSGIGLDVPFNFSLRNALVPLSEQPGFNELAALVPPGAMIPYTFAGRQYALPEELMFNVLFYRQDIFDEFDLSIPFTWDDTIRMLPTLQQNNMDFWIAWGDWLTFYYQFQVQIYSDDGLDVVLDSEEGFEVFRFWSDLYTRFNFPVRIGSFYQSFRRGHIPIGVSGIQDYFMFNMAAPELAGLWGIAPIPGVINDDGVNVRWQTGGQNGVILFRTDEVRENKGWQFIDWWLQTETQTRFALDLEFSLGPEFRWFSANPEVVEAIPWNENTRRTILTQMEWYKGTPFAPGGSYLLQREMQNALADVVLDGHNYRDTLLGATRAVRQEMQRVQRLFNFIDDDGNVLRTADMLHIPLPPTAVPIYE